MKICETKNCLEVTIKARSEAFKKLDKKAYNKHNGHMTAGHRVQLFKSEWK